MTRSFSLTRQAPPTAAIFSREYDFIHDQNHGEVRGQCPCGPKGGQEVRGIFFIITVASAKSRDFRFIHNPRAGIQLVLIN